MLTAVSAVGIGTSTCLLDRYNAYSLYINKQPTGLHFNGKASASTAEHVKTHFALCQTHVIVRRCFPVSHQLYVYYHGHINHGELVGFLEIQKIK